MNMKKIGLTALAASLVSFSANAGEMTVSGAASISVGGYSAGAKVIIQKHSLWVTSLQYLVAVN